MEWQPVLWEVSYPEHWQEALSEISWEKAISAGRKKIVMAVVAVDGWAAVVVVVVTLQAIQEDGVAISRATLEEVLDN